jgi:hypothetical protein
MGSAWVAASPTAGVVGGCLSFDLPVATIAWTYASSGLSSTDVATACAATGGLYVAP